MPTEGSPSPIYRSPRWRALIRELIEERGAQCENPGCRRTDGRIFGDHIVELQDRGAPFAKSNVRLLCNGCHVKKTNLARAARAKGQRPAIAYTDGYDASGNPLDPNHPWNRGR